MNIYRGMTAALVCCLMLTGSDPAWAVEEAEYEVIRTAGEFEVREYAPSLVAEVVVDEPFEDAGNKAFRPLFNYIDGNNRSQQKIAMTAPVSQQKSTEKIAMTAPVSQTRSDAGWTVSFMMPAEFTAQTIPLPEDPRVTLREVPAWRAVVIRYSGTWSQARYQEHLDQLMEWVGEQGLEPGGDPIWARYNGPFTPWFLRRNEILLPINPS